MMDGWTDRRTKLLQMREDAYLELAFVRFEITFSLSLWSYHFIAGVVVINVMVNLVNMILKIK